MNIKQFKKYAKDNGLRDGSYYKVYSDGVILNFELRGNTALVYTFTPNNYCHEMVLLESLKQEIDLP